MYGTTQHLATQHPGPATRAQHPPARVGLHVDAPGGGVQVESLQGASLAEVLNLVNVLIAAIVAGALQWGWG